MRIDSSVKSELRITFSDVKETEVCLHLGYKALKHVEKKYGGFLKWLDNGNLTTDKIEDALVAFTAAQGDHAITPKQAEALVASVYDFGGQKALTELAVEIAQGISGPLASSASPSASRPAG